MTFAKRFTSSVESACHSTYRTCWFSQSKSMICASSHCDWNGATTYIDLQYLLLCIWSSNSRTDACAPWWHLVGWTFPTDHQTLRDTRSANRWYLAHFENQHWAVSPATTGPLYFLRRLCIGRRLLSWGPQSTWGCWTATNRCYIAMLILKMEFITKDCWCTPCFLLIRLWPCQACSKIVWCRNYEWTLGTHGGFFWLFAYGPDGYTIDFSDAWSADGQPSCPYWPHD